MPGSASRAPRRPWIPLLVVAILASIGFVALNDRFLTGFNIYVVLSSATLLSLIGYSQLTVLSVGEFSLAVGGIGEFVGILVGFLLVTVHCPLPLALLAGLLAGTLCGLANGLLVAKSHVSGFIITLATGGAFAGLSLAITQTLPYTGLPAALNSFGTGRFGPIPYAASLAVIAAGLLGTLYRWRRAGRTMLAVGGNAEAAALSGLSHTSAILWGHTLSGLLAGTAGMLAMAQLHEANASAGTDWLIQSFTIPVIGGTLLTGGSVSVFGILVASLILATINDGLILINVDPFWVTLVEGALVFVAVLLGRAQNWRLMRWIATRRRREEMTTELGQP